MSKTYFPGSTTFSALRREFSEVGSEGNRSALSESEEQSNRPAKKSSGGSPRITLRLTEAENTRLRELADGVTLSSYVRERLFGKDANQRKTRRRHKPVADEQSLARVLAMLGETRLANNLNQIAYQANTGELIMDQRTLVQIEEAYVHIGEMRANLVAALGLIESRS
jgi:hypothetical protein